MSAPDNRSAYLAAVLARALPDASPHRIMLAVSAMQHAATAHKAWGVRRCNENMTEAQQKRGENRLAGIARKASEVLSVCSSQHTCGSSIKGGMTYVSAGERVCEIRLEFGGDPRGCCGTLRVSGQTGDGWGGGFPIYGRG